MIPLKTIEELISKHSLLEKELSAGNVDRKLFAEKSKEYSDLNDVIDDAKKYFSYEVEKGIICFIYLVFKVKKFYQKI